MTEPTRVAAYTDEDFAVAVNVRPHRPPCDFPDHACTCGAAEDRYAIARTVALARRAGWDTAWKAVADIRTQVTHRTRPDPVPVFRGVIPPSGAGYDADTVTIWLDQWFGDWKHEVGIRLEGSNSEEISTPGPEGEDQRDFVRMLLVPGTRLMLRTKVNSKDRPVQSFERYVGELWLTDEVLEIPGEIGEVSVNRWLIWANAVVPWDGKSQPPPVPDGPVRAEALEWIRTHRPGTAG
jgi:hypothetical protein